MGKSKLAVELAKRFGGEVINADSMQVYDALPIATNRVTEAEADGIPHHLLGFLAPTEVYHAGRFLEDVLPVLEDIWARGKLAIVVGGTHYYIEALIFKTLIGAADDEPPAAMAGSSSSSSRGSNCSGGGTGSSKEGPAVEEIQPAVAAPPAGQQQTLHEMLSEVDPTMARRLHPNDTRKIQRCLDLYRMQGVPRSETLLQDGKDGDVLRFDRPCCCLWVDCDFSVLDPRLDARIDTMLKAGLLEEQHLFRKKLAAEQPPALYKNAHSAATPILLAGSDRGGGERPTGNGAGEASVGAKVAAGTETQGTDPGSARVMDYSKGVLQAIGFKEFAAYFALKSKQGGSHLDGSAGCGGGGGGGSSSDSTNASGSDDGAAAAIFEECIDKMKRSTRRYAKKQVTWIQRRLMQGPPCEQLYLHKFNASDLAVWGVNVLQEAVQIVQAHTTGSTPPPGIARKPKPSKAEALLQWRKYTCDVCNGKVLNGDHEWQAHTKSKAHRNRTKKRKSRIPQGTATAVGTTTIGCAPGSGGGHVKST